MPASRRTAPRNGDPTHERAHLWRAHLSRLRLIDAGERNLIVDCARGIGLGPGDDPARGHQGGVARGNVVVARRPVMDTGIGLQQARGARVVHNTTWAAPAAAGRLFSGIDPRFAGTNAVVQNNIVVTRITPRGGATSRMSSSAGNPPASWFRDPLRLERHLRPNALVALGVGYAVPDGGLDIKGEPCDKPRPDPGADEAQ